MTDQSLTGTRSLALATVGFAPECAEGAVFSAAQGADPSVGEQHWSRGSEKIDFMYA